ncbi:DNA ligase [Neptunomonas sp.]|uniref:DNA ligase n=1 Tax=Neptunomonas sp. TaxID=1971898 RepID=UPI0035697882
MTYLRNKYAPHLYYTTSSLTAWAFLGGLTGFLLSSSGLAAANTDKLPALQLAGSLDHADLNIDLKGYWYAEKLDGVRGYWDGRQLLTRQGNPIHAPEWFTRALPDFAVEGELWIGRQKFDHLSGVVRQQQADESRWRQVRFYLFDLPHYPGTFGQRRTVLEKWVTSIGQPHIQAVALFPFVSHQALLQQLADWTEQGAEGVMLYRSEGLYQAGRSDDLLKLKGYEDAEARVVAILPGKGKYQGMLGALLVENSAGVQFKVGSGFTDAERKAPPQMGTMITYRYNGKTRNGIPRFARFERIRLDD